MNSKPIAFLALLASLTTTLPAWAKAIPDDFATSLVGGKMQSDEELTDCGALTVSAAIDLNGHKLTLKGVTTATLGSHVISDSSSGTPGELWIEHSKSVTQSTAFTGNLKFIKDGAGKWTLPQTSSYSGGTEVYNGTLTTDTKTRKIASSFKPYGTGSSIDIYGGIVQGQAFTEWKGSYELNLRGGTYKNINANNTAYGAFNVPINVYVDSTYASSANYSLAGDVTLNDKTLTMSITSGNTIHFNPASVSQGKLVFTGSGSYTLQKNCELTVVDASLESTLKLNGKTLDVKDFSLKSGGSVSGLGSLRVHGTYAPTAVDGYYPVMVDGSTLDLSGLTEAATPTAANFDSGTVTIALGSRTLESNQQIVSWTAKPEGVEFAFTGDNIAAGKSFTVSDSGIVYDAKSDVVTSATWTGKGEAGNWNDPNNWECKNASDQVVEGKCPTTDLTPSFTGNVASITFDSTFPFAGARFTDAYLAKEKTWSGFDLNKISSDSVIDLRGKSLTLSATNGISTSEATFTNSTDTVTALNFSVDDGNVFTNATLNFAGNLKLVKKGAGTFVAVKYPQEYAGVTEIAEGLVRCGISNMNANGAKTEADAKSIFGAARTIDLPAGGVLDPAGSYSWGYHTINMNGGVISNTVKATGLATSAGKQMDFSAKGGNTNVGQPFNPVINLVCDGTIFSTDDFNCQGRIHANGHALSLSLAKGLYCLWNPTDAADLHLRIVGGGTLGVWCKSPVAYGSQAGLVLDVENGDLALSKHATYGSGDMGVSNYIASAATTVNEGGAALTVSGTFTPNSDCFYGCTMADGSKIDLSGKTAAWSTTSLAENNNTVKFADGATVTLDVGSRTLTLGEQVLAWTTKPLDATFVFAGENVDPDVPVVCGVDGIAYGYAKEPEIVWSGKAGNGDLTDPDNWEGGVVPTTIKATFTGDVSNLNVPAGKSFAAEKIWFKEATLSQNADFSWLDINRVTDESILDLCGHDLALACTDGVCTNAGTVTDSAVAGGTVSFSVAENCVYTNKHFSFSGSLNFVKEGAGLLVAEKYPQTYAGTTAIAAGGIRCGEKINMNAQAEQSPFGSTCTVTVNDGAYLDPAGSYAWGYHTVVLNGGIISNTVVQTGMNNDNFNAASTAFVYPFNPRLVLEKDATLVTVEAFNFKGAIVANGHTLTIEMPSDFRFFPTEAENAVVETKGAGALRLLKNFKLEVPTMTLIMNGPKFDMGGFMAVSNYVAKSESIFAEVRSSWTKPVVYGTFTPATNNFLGCVLQEGATLDLSEKEGAWSVLRREDLKSTNTCDYVSFADNATVTLDIGVRTHLGGKPLVSWTEATKPSNLETLTFVLNKEAQANHYKIDIRDDGVYAVCKGFEILVR